MGFAQWFWRLFLVFAGLIVAHVLVVTGILAFRNPPPEYRNVLLWTSAGLTILFGGLATWACIRRIIEPLSELTRHARAASASGEGVATALDSPDELGVLADGLQPDAARPGPPRRSNPGEQSAAANDARHDGRGRARRRARQDDPAGQ